LGVIACDKKREGEQGNNSKEAKTIFQAKDEESTAKTKSIFGPREAKPNLTSETILQNPEVSKIHEMHSTVC
jgi:hypothetical protein